MQESQSRLTRSSSTNSNTDRHPSTLESFLERFKEKAQNKSGDPYPFQCFTPSEKEESGSKRASTNESGLLTDKSMVRPDTLTVSSSSGQSLQEMFSPLSSVVPMSEGRSSDCTIIGEHVPHTATCSESRDADENISASGCPPQTSTNAQPKRSMLLEDILQAPDLNPLPWAKDSESATCSRYSEHRCAGSAEKQPQRHAGKRRRCPSAESNDSISPEISHFKPIQSCPRTPPRTVDGKLVDPPVVWTTPHNLKQLQRRSSNDDQQGLKFSEGRSPAMQRRLRVLAEDRRRQVEANSKSTSTLLADSPQAASVRLKHSSVSDSRFCVSTSPYGLQTKPRAPCTISSETQLDVNSNESPCSSSVDYRDKSDAFKHNNIPTWLNGVSVSDRVPSPDIGGVGKEGKHVLPLVSCVDDFDEFDGSPPMPDVSFLNKGGSEASRNLFSTDVSSPEIKSCLPSVSRNLFHTSKDGTSKTKSVKKDRQTTPVSVKKRGKLSKSRSRQNSVAKRGITSPQMSLKEMFSRVQDTKKDHKGLGLSPCFASACSTPLADEGSVQMKSLINQALDSLERDDTNVEAEPKKVLSKEHPDLLSMCGQKTIPEKCESDDDVADSVQQTIDMVASPEKVLNCKRKEQRCKKSAPRGKTSHPQTNTLEKFMRRVESSVEESPCKKAKRNVKRKRKRVKDPDYVCYPEDSDSGLDFEEVPASQKDSKTSKTSPPKRKNFKGYVWVTDDEEDPSYEPPGQEIDISPEKTPKRTRRKTYKARRTVEETPEKEGSCETKSDLEVSPSRRLSGRKRRKPVYLYYDDTDEEASNDTPQSSREAHVSGTNSSQPACYLTNLKRQPIRRDVDTKSERMKNDIVESSPEKGTCVSKVSPNRKSERSPLKGKSNLMSDGCVSCKESGSSRKTEKNETQVANPSTRNLKRTRLTSSHTEKSPPKGRGCSVPKNRTDSKTVCDLETQEELDRQLAFQLQKEFELELRKSRIVDRSKGSSDEYSFRRREKNLLSPVASHTRNSKSKK